MIVVASLNNSAFANGYVMQKDLLGIPDGGWKEIFNSDGEAYGGQNVGNRGAVIALVRRPAERRHPRGRLRRAREAVTSTTSPLERRRDAPDLGHRDFAWNCFCHPPAEPAMAVARMRGSSCLITTIAVHRLLGMAAGTSQARHLDTLALLRAQGSRVQTTEIRRCRRRGVTWG